jgi:hypothetical protein
MTLFLQNSTSLDVIYDAEFPASPGVRYGVIAVAGGLAYM